MPATGTVPLCLCASVVVLFWVDRQHKRPQVDGNAERAFGANCRPPSPIPGILDKRVHFFCHGGGRPGHPRSYVRSALGQEGTLGRAEALYVSCPRNSPAWETTADRGRLQATGFSLWQRTAGG